MSSTSTKSSESVASTAEAYAPPADQRFWIRAIRGIGICVLPILVALYVGATTFGGSFIPWHPNMVDLEVYRRAGSVLLAGGDFYDLSGQLQFLYPPFAAVLAVPLSLLPPTVVQIGWTAAGAVALVAILHRFGLSGWLLSLASAVVVYVVEPVVQTLAFGQLGIFLVALVVLDLAPGPRVLSRRVLPEGVLTAVATALKLTPAIFIVYLLAVRKFRAFWVAVITGLAVTLISAAIVPAASHEFWTRLARGDTGLGAQRHLLHESVFDGRHRAHLRARTRSGDRRTRPVRCRRTGGRMGSNAVAPAGRCPAGSQPLRRCGTAGLTRVLAAPLRLGGSAGHESPRATADQSAPSPGLVSGSGLALCRVGGRGTVH